jgi:hypothetical protein
MKKITMLITLSLLLGAVIATPAFTQNALPGIQTPSRVESHIGTLEFKDGMPSAATLEKVYDNLDRTHAFEAFVNTMQGVNAVAIHKGFLDIGVKDNEILIFSELMDAKSLFLTANADTVYFVGFIDLSKGPMVFEAPPMRWARSMTSGGAGSRILARPGLIVDSAANTSCSRRITTERCQRAGSSLAARGQHASCCSVARL